MLLVSLHSQAVFSSWLGLADIVSCLQTKHAAELLALLVNDLFGELPSVWISHTLWLVDKALSHGHQPS